MSAYPLFLAAALCIPITVFAYLFYSIPFLNRLLRTKSAYFFDTRLLLATLLFYGAVFVAVEAAFLYRAKYSFFAYSWAIQGIFLFVVTMFVFGAIHLATRGLSITAPRLHVEKLISLQGPFEDVSALFLEVIGQLEGEVILDSLDQKIIIARVPVFSFGIKNSQQEVILEFSFAPTFFNTVLTQMVCYSASRGVFVEKKAMHFILERVELLYTEKFLESLL